ncbi:type II secretion system F family protein [Phenylobacterium soli]|uniref:Secretion system protein n=1 Tax=Phenylobacterium soli TaxID=2170551 RepID=A0A328ALU1_9CAUL|nr:type II secretion system F family protein [Phenylobacterium soli]RAK55933.1 secretion system protein [Phenylobacterium soli]
MGLLIVTIILVGLGAIMLATAFAGAQSASRTLARRVDLIAHASRTSAAEEAFSAARWLAGAEEALKRLFSLGLRRRWGAPTPGRVLLLYALGAAAAGWLLGHAVLRLPDWIAGLVAAAGFLLLPRFVLSLEQSRAEAKFTDLFPDGIDMVIRMLRAGLPVSAAIRTVGNEAPEPVNHVFTELADQVEIGIPLSDALATSGERIQLPDFRFFTVAVSLQHATGGNLAASLEILSEIIRRRRALRLKARAVTAEVRMTAYILGCIPFVIIAGLLFIQPGYLEPLYVDPRGQVIALSAIGSLVAGFLTMRSMMRKVLKV